MKNSEKNFEKNELIKMKWEKIIKEESKTAKKAFSMLEESLAHMREAYHESDDKRFLKLSEDIANLYDSAFPELGDLYGFRKGE